MRRLIMILFALMCAIGAKGQYSLKFCTDTTSTIRPNCNDTTTIFGKSCVIYYKDTINESVIKYICIEETGSQFYFIKGTDDEIKEWINKPNNLVYNSGTVETYFHVYSNHITKSYPLNFIMVKQKKYITYAESQDPFTWMLKPLNDREKKIGNSYFNK